METIDSNNWMRNKVAIIVATHTGSQQELIDKLTINNLQYGLICIKQLQNKGTAEELVLALESKINILKTVIPF